MALRRDEAADPAPGRGDVPYPEHWEADIVLSDGRAAHLRPITPRDRERLQRFHTSQSERSTYMRFFAPMPTLSEKDLDRFTVVDYHDRVAFVVLVGDDIVAVGRFDVIDGTEAEVAFNVSDRYQGRGLGSVLLEHLAAAARERGVHTFTAEVLPQNHRMINVFTDAGFDVRRHYDDGVVLVEFRIDPTARSIQVMGEREHRAEGRAMERLLHPESVLVVAASSRPDSLAVRILAALDHSGFAGAVHVVAPDLFELRGHRVHARIEDVPGPVSLAVLAIRPAEALDAVETCARIDVGALLLPSGGFAEAGTEGERAQRELVTRARRHGMRVLGPAAFGFLRSGEDPINLTPVPRRPRPGHLALGTQSSALGAMILAGSEERGLGIHEFVGAGNRADVSINDCLQHWEDDEQVEVIGLALESMGNPRKFTRIARRLTRRTPVVVLRPPGTSGDAPPGHDVRGSTLPRRALDDLIAASGAVRARSSDEMLDILDVFCRQGVPAGRRVGLLANTPGLGATLRGAADGAGLNVVAENRDIPLMGRDRMVLRAVTRMAAPGGVDVIVLAVLDDLDTDQRRMIRDVAAVARGSGVVLVTCLISDPERFTLVQGDVRADRDLPPLHETPALAVRAAAGALRHLDRPCAEDPVTTERDDVDRPAAQQILQRTLDRSAGQPADLDAQDVRDLLAAYGLDLLPARRVADAEEALAAATDVGYPVALKSTDPVLSHRPDLGGVRLAIPDAAQLRHAVQAMREDLAFSDADLMVQPMAPPGVGVVLRSTEDPMLGPVLSFSLAGDATDLLDDVAYAFPPLSTADVTRLIRTPRTAVKLRGGNGLPSSDEGALVTVIERIGLMAEQLPELASLELYPVLVGQRGVSLIGARARVARAPNRTDGDRRVLPGSGPVEAPTTEARPRRRGRMSR